MVNQEIINAKIESLRRCVSRIREKTPKNSQALCDDFDIQDIISVNLERAVQNCVDIASHIIADANEVAPDTMGKTFKVLQRMNFIDCETADDLIAAVGFRNIAVHAYQDIDWEVVYSIVTKKLDVFQNFIKQILSHM